MLYLSGQVYYMSGTGNSYRAAVWVAETMRDRGIDTEVIQVGTRTCTPEGKSRSTNLVGVVMPTHGFTAPWPVIHFALCLPRCSGMHAFVLVTRAGTKIGPVPFPGLEGTAGYLIAFLLWLKGYRIRGVMGLDMPSNWMALHWGLKLKNAQFIIDRAKQKACSFIDAIIKGKTVHKGLIPLGLGILLSPVSLLYLILGRFCLAKLFFASFRCNGCGLCARSCQAGAIQMTGKVPRPYWTYKCESCMRCMAYCPNRAIEVSHSLALILYYLTLIPVSVYLANFLSGIWPGISIVNTTVFGYFVYYGYTLLAFFWGYLAFFLLNKMSIFNRLFTYTTLTYFYRRYHEPETRIEDLVKQRQSYSQRTEY